MKIKDTMERVVHSARDVARGMRAELESEGSNAQATEAAPDALAIIKADHERVSALFGRILADEANVTKRRPIVAEVIRELETHAKMEETIFYPALRKRSKADDEDRQRVLEAVEEHGTLKDLIKKIKKSTGRDETLKAKVQVLKELVEHHVHEEEEAMFEEARRLLGETRLRALGVEIAAFKSRGRSGPKKARVAASRASKAPTRKSAGSTEASANGKGSLADKRA